LAFDTEILVPGFVAPRLPEKLAEPAALDAADRRARHWHGAYDRELRPGSDAHKLAVCQMFRETFNPYRPSVIAWPTLKPEALERVKSLPIWDIAVHTEGKARLKMALYAATVTDPDMRAAIALNAWEENRHKDVLKELVQAYGIALEPEPRYVPPRNAEWGYVVTAYSECIDSFFAFGLFEMARRSGLFPEELVETFEPVMQDECRHILLFANWIAWHRANLPWWRRCYFELQVAAAWVHLACDRIGLARSMGRKETDAKLDTNFTLKGAQAVSEEKISVADLLRVCIEENDRRFAGYDRRLLRPTTMPSLVRFALRFMRSKRATR
jgi:hypothetical protein